MSEFKPSEYQQAIADWVVTGRGHAAISAVAGSGKTTTLVKVVAPLLKGKALFVAFNKSIATELGERLKGTGVFASTIHSAGFSAVKATYRGSQVKGDKYRKIIRDLIQEGERRYTLAGQDLTRGQEEGLLGEVGMYGVATKVIDLARLTLVGLGDMPGDMLCDRAWSAISNMAFHYGIDLQPYHEEWLRLAIPHILSKGLALASASVDFTDMLWIPVVDRGVKANLRRYDWLLVDECQDLNACQLSLVKSMLRPGGRMLAVGDPHQAIYGFAGADARSFQNIIEEMDAEVLPLSICYRCPSDVVAMAREIVPHIEAAPEAPQGVVQSISHSKMVKDIQEGDMVLCRTTRPVVELAFELIRLGIPATVKGRDIGRGLIATIKKVAAHWRKNRKFRLTFDDFEQALCEYQVGLEAKLAKREDSEAQIQRLEDTCSTLRVISEQCGGDHLSDIEDTINSLFSDQRGSVTLSTIHRAKGLEERRVFILCPELLPHPMAKLAWQREQEENLRYVAYTRSQGALYIVEGGS